MLTWKTLIDDPVWVMNNVPVEAKINTLGVVYERGLIGTYQNWLSIRVAVVIDACGEESTKEIVDVV
ncbi:putative methyltransferase PMT16 [Trifolium repens]|nr:putative methyltransferase PMT16 [Trifolium repens]